MEFDVENIKKDFPIFTHNKGLVYLDSAASSQTPSSVINKISEYYTGYRSNIHRSMYKMGEIATIEYEKARDKVADFIGAESEEVVFTPGSTGGMNMLIYSLEQLIDFDGNSNIVTTVTEHHSTFLPLFELARRRGVSLRYIPIKEDYHLDYNKAESMIDKHTKLVVVSLAGNVLGTINDTIKISDIAHGVGALVIGDGAKAAGHMEIDVNKTGCDFVVFSGHKMCGPTGIGVLYGRKNILEILPPSVFGGGAVEYVDLSRVEYKNTPLKFEAGTPNIVGAIGLGEAVKYLSGLGVAEVHNHIKALTRYGLSVLKNIDGVRVFSQMNPDNNIGILSFSVEGIHPHDIAEIAGRENVAIRAGHHCASPLMGALGVSSLVRASFYIYNKVSDIDALAASIEKAQQVFKIK